MDKKKIVTVMMSIIVILKSILNCCTASKEVVENIDVVNTDELAKDDETFTDDEKDYDKVIDAHINTS